MTYGIYERIVKCSAEELSCDDLKISGFDAVKYLKDAPSEGLLKLGIAPVKKAHWIEASPLSTEILASNRAVSPRKEDPPLSKRQQSKALNKERKDAQKSKICFKFANNSCNFGDKCRYRHDTQKLAEEQQAPALPGICPFAQQKECPYASHHESSVAELLIQASNGDSSQCAKTSLSNSPVPEVSKSKPPLVTSPGSEQMDAPDRDFAAADLQSTNTNPCWPRSDGSVPMEILNLPVLPLEQPTINTLSKDLQRRLWKISYDFSKADQIVKKLGAKVTMPTRKVEQTEPGASPTASRKRARLEEESTKLDENASFPVKENLQSQNDESTLDSKAAATSQLQDPADASLQPCRIFDISNGGAHGGSRSNDCRGISNERLDWARENKDTPLKPREKRHIDFRGKLYLAPLTTTGNLPFRRICKSLGADITCGEMALATCLLKGRPSEWALLKRHPSEDLFGVQICGGYVDSMVRCAQLLEENIEVDFVDINMGCPIDLVCSKLAGSALLQRPARLEQIVRGVSGALSCALTIKVRRGFNDGHDVAHEILPKAASWGAAAATLHGRSREQRYTKLADWDYISRCASAATPMPLIGNGDIFSFEDYEAHMAACPQLTTAMIARGALIKPWLFTEIKERRHWDVSAGERLDLLKQFCSAGLLHWGSDEKGVETTRRFLLEWMSFLCRYIPVGLLEVVPQQMTWRPPFFCGRSDLETLLGSQDPDTWVAISELLLGPTPKNFKFTPKHKSNAYDSSGKSSASRDQENG